MAVSRSCWRAAVAVVSVATTGAVAAASPFRLGGRPNVTLGVATITSDPAAVALYERLAERLWAAALKGEAAAARLRMLAG
jgi:anti-sigma-K factor RskA